MTTNNATNDTHKRKRENTNTQGNEDQLSDKDDHSDSSAQIQSLERFFGKDQAEKYSFKKKTLILMKKTIAEFITQQYSTSSACMRAGQSRQLRKELATMSGVDVPKKHGQYNALLAKTSKEVHQTRKAIIRRNSVLRQDDDVSSQGSEVSIKELQSLAKASGGLGRLQQTVISNVSPPKKTPSKTTVKSYKDRMSKEEMDQAVALQREKEPTARISEHSFDLRLALACLHFRSSYNVFVAENINRLKMHMDVQGKDQFKNVATKLGTEWTKMDENKDQYDQLLQIVRDLNETQLKVAKPGKGERTKEEKLETLTVLLKQHIKIPFSDTDKEENVQLNIMRRAIENLTESSPELNQILTKSAQSELTEIKEAAVNTLARISPNCQQQVCPGEGTTTWWENKGNGISSCLSCLLQGSNSGNFECGSCYNTECLYWTNKDYLANDQNPDKLCGDCHRKNNGQKEITSNSNENQMQTDDLPTTYPWSCPVCQKTVKWENNPKIDESNCSICNLFATNSKGPCSECPNVDFL